MIKRKTGWRVGGKFAQRPPGIKQTRGPLPMYAREDRLELEVGKELDSIGLLIADGR